MQLPEPDSHASEAARGELFRFAQALQNAAVYLAQRGEKSPHTAVKVLLLAWDEDEQAPRIRSDREDERSRLEGVMTKQLGWTVHQWNVPAQGLDDAGCECVLGDALDSFFDGAGQDELRVVYYSGLAVLNGDDELCWTR